MTGLRDVIQAAVMDCVNAWAAGEGCDELLDPAYGAAITDAAFAAIESSGFVVMPAKLTDETVSAVCMATCSGMTPDGVREVYDILLAARPRDVTPTEKSNAV